MKGIAAVINVLGADNLIDRRFSSALASIKSMPASSAALASLILVTRICDSFFLPFKS